MMTEKIEAPGPGVWTLDGSHFQRPMSRFVREHFIPAFESGQAQMAERYGVPMKTVGMRAVADGFIYVQTMPLGGPPGGKPPPRPILRLLFKLVPELRRRRRTAERVFPEKFWREDLRVWRDETLPALFARMEALQGEDLEALDDEGLADHLDQCAVLIFDSVEAHIRTNGMTCLPTGDFVVHAQAWTGASTLEILEAMRTSIERGSSRAGQVRAALDAAGELAVLDGEPAEVIERLRAHDGEVGALAREWLRQAEPRQIFTGDLHQPTGRERPDLLVTQLREGRPMRAPSDEATAALREQVPAEHRAEFDALLAEARSTFDVRDERCAVLDTWVFGVCRRAVQAAGARLVERGHLEEAIDAMHMESRELRARLCAGEGPELDEIRRRRASHERTIDEMPRFLGGVGMPAPDHELFPGAIGRVMRAMFLYVGHMDEPVEDKEADARETVTGMPASQGVHEGTARVVLTPADFERIEPGDVLVARCTMPSYNGVMALSGAVVTDRGGALSHAAIVSRELGIPAVVGTRDATKKIPDGARVRVDGAAGRVEVLS